MDATESGRLGGQAKEANIAAERRRYTDAMPPLDSPENCKRRLEVIQDMTLRGLLAGSAAGAAVRSCEAWLKAYQTEIDRNRMRELERQIETLEKQLAATRVGRRVS
jgi:hypothetical protein